MVKALISFKRVMSESSFYSGPPVEFLAELLRITLECNYFRFEKSFYLQLEGMAMGAAMAPSYANIYMYMFEQEHLLIPYGAQLIAYSRFVDDIFIIWQGNMESFDQMVIKINNLSTPIKITSTRNTHIICFLDIQVIRSANEEKRVPGHLPKSA